MSKRGVFSSAIDMRRRSRSVLQPRRRTALF
jgi:hypothetical protein